MINQVMKMGGKSFKKIVKKSLKVSGVDDILNKIIFQKIPDFLKKKLKLNLLSCLWTNTATWAKNCIKCILGDTVGGIVGGIIPGGKDLIEEQYKDCNCKTEKTEKNTDTKTPLEGAVAEAVGETIHAVESATSGAAAAVESATSVAGNIVSGVTGGLIPQLQKKSSDKKKKIDDEVGNQENATSSATVDGKLSDKTNVDVNKREKSVFSLPSSLIKDTVAVASSKLAENEGTVTGAVKHMISGVIKSQKSPAQKPLLKLRNRSSSMTEESQEESNFV